MRKAAFAFCLALAACPAVEAGESNGTSAAFLELGTGARSAALGGAYSALARGADALNWNPGAIRPANRISAAISHAAYLDSSYFEHAAYAQRIGKGALGVSVQYFSSGKIPQTDLSGGEVGSFAPHDLAVSLGYSRSWRGYSLGFAGKFIRTEVIDSAQTKALDLGFLSPAYFGKRLRLAATALNIGDPIQLGEKSAPLPLAYHLGSSYRLSRRWTAGLEIQQPRNEDLVGAFGTEYVWQVNGWALAGRAGLNTLALGDQENGLSASLGLGFYHLGLGVDYAFVPYGSIGFTHRLSISYSL